MFNVDIENLPIFENSDIISFQANITDVEYVKGDLDDSVPILKLEDGKAKFQLYNLTLILATDYAYISDPPLFADIGTANLKLTGVCLEFEFDSNLQWPSSEPVFTVNVDQLGLNFIGDMPLADF